VFSFGTARGLLVAAVALLPVGSAMSAETRDPFFGEALYYAYQGHFFEALERLDTEIGQHYKVDEPELDTLHPYIDRAEFSVGDFELYYRMHNRAGRAIRAILEGKVEEPVRNEAAFRLAKIHFQKDQPNEALRALEGITGRIPEAIRDDIEFLRANIYLAMNRPSDAVDVLRDLQGSEDLEGFSQYNFGIALLQDGRYDEAIRELDRAGQVATADPATLAIRDKSNLVLGTLQSESSEFGPAQLSLERVRLDGPFSNQALLRAGWAEASAKNFERALVPWGILVQRESTDAAVHEAMLALPYAYSQLNVHGRAAVLYEQAVQDFGNELDKVNASIERIQSGGFLEALAREEIRQNEDWVVRLRSLPEAPETFYLLSLMASHDFHTSLQNYLDLEDLRSKLVSWQRSLDSFEDMIRLRQVYYEPLLPEIDRQFRKLDAQVRLRREQREHLDLRLQQMLIVPNPDALATSEERRIEARLEQLAAGLQNSNGPAAERLRQRVERLRGALRWNVETQYHERLTEAHEHLRELNEDMATMTAQYDAFVRARQAATHSYVGYEVSINRLRVRVGEALERMERLMAQQGHILETVAIDELAKRREQLEAYQNQARFAFADSYDRAAKAQVR
jgi:tetratricopeptide (TPR) repeat protein